MIATDQATRIVSNIVYKPGWTFEGDNYSMSNTYWVSVFFPARNSNREFARNGYPVSLFPGGARAFPIELDECQTEDDFMDALTAGLIGVENHETCEFLRRRDQDYAAPFHPHRPEGIAAWRRLLNRFGTFSVADNYADA